MTIFSLSMAVLLPALAMVESDNGATSANVYQLSNVYIEDVNRIYHLRVSTNDKFDKRKSERIVFLYLFHYGAQYYKRTGSKPTYEVLARIHNGGPNGWRKECTVRYWEKVKKHIKTIENQ